MTEQTKIDYVALVLEADIPKPTQKHILLTIAALANENGKCRPSITRLEILTGLNRRTITRNLKKLEKELWLYIHRQGTPTRKETNFYELNPLKLQIIKVTFESRGTKPLGKTVEAQTPYPRGTTPPNTNTTTPAPLPTAALQAQAGGSGAGSNNKREDPFKKQPFNTETFNNKHTPETEPKPFEDYPFAQLDQPGSKQVPEKEDRHNDFGKNDEAEEVGVSDKTRSLFP
jgi:hypothetical protein